MSRKKLKDTEKKMKISITIEKDVFDSLNDYISKNKKTNRSSLIEKLLKKYKNLDDI